MVILELGKRTHGNAHGMEYADIITKELIDDVDFTSTYTNAITAGELFAVKVPLTANSDKEAIDLALNIIKKRASDVRLVRIKNSLKLSEIIVSETIYNEIKNEEFFKIDRRNILGKMRFNENGKLI